MYICFGGMNNMDKKHFIKLFLFFGILIAVITFNSANSRKVLASYLLQAQDESTSYLPIISKGMLLPTLTPTPSPTGQPTIGPSPTLPPIGDAIVIDHNSVALFDQIPEQYLTIARNTPMLFSDRSVGVNIDAFLDCLAAGFPNDPNDWPEAPASCRRDFYEISGSTWIWKTFSETDYNNNDVPNRILYDPDPDKYNRSNWTFVYAAGDWESLIDGFVSQIVPQNVNANNVLSFQFSYLNIDHGSTIDDADIGFFVDLPHDGYYDNRERWDISDLEDLETQYPTKTFIYWTTSLSRGLGSIDGQNFNNQMRQYAISNDKILFDVADIESHDENGNPCYDNRDGVQYCTMSGTCENHPNDGQNIIAICQDYTTEIDGGHLGSVSGGGIQIAKAFWVLMARLAGWNP